MEGVVKRQLYENQQLPQTLPCKYTHTEVGEVGGAHAKASAAGVDHSASTQAY